MSISLMWVLRGRLRLISSAFDHSSDNPKIIELLDNEVFIILQILIFRNNPDLSLPLSIMLKIKYSNTGIE